MSKYQINQAVFWLAANGLIGLMYLGFQGFINIFTAVPFFLAIAACLHYLLNVIHLASHQQISKRRWLNSLIGNIAAIFGGVTLADFKATHQLHHKNPGNFELDPDHYITTSGHMFWMPFKLWYHDIYFWREGLWRQNRQWLSYGINRLSQLAIIIFFLATGHWWLLVFFWSWPAWLVGFFNGLFLFYFPHYSTKKEEYWRLATTVDLSLWARFSLELIDISRIYHELHHLKITNNMAYFPVYFYLKDKLQKSWAEKQLTYGRRFVRFKSLDLTQPVVRSN
jgi:beta-carotene hydroxylase